MNGQMSMMPNGSMTFDLSAQWHMLPPEKMLEAIRNLGIYGGYGPAVMGLLHEIHMRASVGLGVRLDPADFVQGKSWLFDTKVKNEKITHLFVDNVGDVDEIKGILAKHTDVLERITKLIEMGPVFTIVTCNKYGQPTGRNGRCTYSSFLNDMEFSENAEPRWERVPVFIAYLDPKVFFSEFPRERKGLMEAAASYFKIGVGAYGGIGNGHDDDLKKFLCSEEFLETFYKGNKVMYDAIKARGGDLPPIALHLYDPNASKVGKLLWINSTGKGVTGYDQPASIRSVKLPEPASSYGYGPTWG